MRTLPALMALMLAACTAAAGPSPTAIPLPSPSLTEAPSPTAVPPTSGSLLPGWTSVSVSKPAIVMAIPPDWHQLSLMELRDQLASALPSVTGAIRQSLEAGIADIDSGRIHFVVEGPSAIKPWTASVILSVDTGDVSLEAAVTRIVAEDLAVIGPSVTEERAEIDLPIGKSIRVMTTRNPLGGASSESVEYVVILADGSTLYMAGTSRDGDQPFIEAMDKMALSLAN